MAFKKGMIPWNKGKKGVQKPYWTGKKRGKQSEEWKKKRSDSMKKIVATGKLKTLFPKGIHPETQFKKGHVLGIGKKVSLESRKRMSISHIGKQCGELHPNWKGGVTPINNKIRRSFEYKLWRIAVFERDNYTCIWCGQRGGNLEADHIKPFALFPELRFAIDNGRTLCKECHKKTDTFGRKACTKQYGS